MTRFISLSSYRATPVSPWLVALLFGAALFPHLYKLTWPARELACLFISDDAFYYFKTAQNIAKGFGSTFDTYTFTNGYHPLWMLICVATAWVSTDPDTYVYLIMSVNVIFVLLFSIQLYRMTLSWMGPLFSGLLLCAVNWPFSATFRLFNGLETALFLFLVLVCIELTVTSSFRSSREMLLLGLVLALGFLARTSFVLFAPVFAGYLVLRHRRGERPFSVSTLACLAAPCLFLAVPYLLWNYLQTGHIEQISGLVKRHQNTETALSWLDYARSAWLVAGILLSNIGVYFRSMDRHLVYGVNAVVGGCFAWAAYRHRSALFSLFGDDRMMLLSVLAAMEVGSYIGFYSAGLRHWHVASLILVAQITAVFLVKCLYTSWKYHPWKQWVLASMIAALCLGYLVWIPVVQAGRKGVTGEPAAVQCPDIRLALWLQRNVAHDAKVGGANVGRMGYFSNRNVINLDGLINGIEFYEYLVDGRGTIRYIIDKRIEYVIPDVAHLECLPQAYGVTLERIPVDGELYLYRISYGE